MTRKERFRNVGAGKGVKAQLDRAALEQLYCRDGLSQTEIARRFGCSPQFVSQLVHEYGLHRPTGGRTRATAS
jgi:transposase-like protein